MLPKSNSQKISLNHKIPKQLFRAGRILTERLKQENFEAILVGGCVRDLLLGHSLADIDVTTNAQPEHVRSLFPIHVPVGEKFGTILVLINQIPIEVTTFRKDVIYEDGRRPKKIYYANNFETDVLRRDFTINGLGYDMQKEIVYDHIGGLDDLKHGILRTIGDPNIRFKEDGLRPIRGCRFIASHHLQWEKSTFDAIASNLCIVAKVARERFFDEWRKTLNLKKKSIFWSELYKSGITDLFLPGFIPIFERLSMLDLIRITNMGVYGAGVFDSHEYKKSTTENPRLKQYSFFIENLCFPKKEQKRMKWILNYLDGKLLDKPEEMAWKILSWDPKFRRDISRFVFDRSNLENRNRLLAGYRYIIKFKVPKSLNEMNIRGDELISFGFKGSEIKKTLNRLWYDVVVGVIPNELKALREKTADYAR